MKEKVLEAVRIAFSTDAIEEHLTELDGRVFGSVVVEGSELFLRLDPFHRQKVLWHELGRILSVDALNVGPIRLEEAVHAAAS